MITLAWDLAATWHDLAGIFDMTIPELLDAARHTARIAEERKSIA